MDGGSGSGAGATSRFLNVYPNLDTEREQQQQRFASFNGDDHFGSDFVFGNDDQELSELMAGRGIKAEPGADNWCSDDLGMILNYGNEFAFERSCQVPETADLPVSGGDKGKEAFLTDINSKKRASNFSPAMVEENPLEKKLKTSTENDCKIAEDNGNNKITNHANNLKENSEDSEVAKPNYIRVRARRGQATDSHSLAERVRRQKLSAKMKYLQGLVPGCNMITGKAGMLDEIINYVQSLQRQVQFLSMKLATIAPRMDLGMDSYMAKEMFSAFPAMIGVSSLRQSGLEIGLTALDVSLRRTNSAPIEKGLDSPHMNQIQQVAPDMHLENLLDMEFQQGRSAHFIYDQPFTGFVEAGNVKLEEM